MSDKNIKKKGGDTSIKEEDIEKTLNMVKHHTIKIDFDHLEGILRFMNNSHKQLSKRVTGIERRMDQDERFDIMNDQIKHLETYAAETRVSISNIQGKIIDIEK